MLTPHPLCASQRLGCYVKAQVFSHPQQLDNLSTQQPYPTKWSVQYVLNVTTSCARLQELKTHFCNVSLRQVAFDVPGERIVLLKDTCIDPAAAGDGST